MAGVPLMDGKEAFIKQVDMTRMEGLREGLAPERDGWELGRRPEDVHS